MFIRRSQVIKNGWYNVVKQTNRHHVPGRRAFVEPSILILSSQKHWLMRNHTHTAVQRIKELRYWTSAVYYRTKLNWNWKCRLFVHCTVLWSAQFQLLHTGTAPIRPCPWHSRMWCVDPNAVYPASRRRKSTTATAASMYWLAFGRTEYENGNIHDETPFVLLYRTTYFIICLLGTWPD
jgi:hypothetical protein